MMFVYSMKTLVVFVILYIVNIVSELRIAMWKLYSGHAKQDGGH